MPVDSYDNVISISGYFGDEEFPYVSSALHRIVDRQSYSDFTVDFSNCTRAFSVSMLPLCAISLKYWRMGVDIYLRPPKDETLRRLFDNTGWAHFIDHRSHAESRYRGFTHSPALRFTNGSEQNHTVNRAMDVLLAAVQHMSRDELRYLEWVLTELTDNVINHAESPCGGLLQITNHRARKEIEIVVSDAGLGIPATLSSALAPRYTPAEILQFAIRENVTRDKSVGQGNGLYGSWRVAQLSGGAFSISSGLGRLSSPQAGEVKVKNERIPVPGTTVQARIGYDRQVDLSKVMVFPNSTFEPVDYVETHFEEDEHGNIVFKLAEESDGFGSRASAKPVRRKLENLSEHLSTGRIQVLMEGIKLVSSSYADEVFGKLFLKLGPINFMQKIQLVRPDPLVKGLIDRAITQRMMQGVEPE